MSSPVPALNNIDKLLSSPCPLTHPESIIYHYADCAWCIFCTTISLYHNPPAAIIICSPTDRPNAPNSRTHLSFASQRQLKPPFGVIIRESPVACSGTSNNASRQGIVERGLRKVTVHRVIYVNYANCKELSSTTTLRTLGAAYKIFISHNEEEGKAAAKNAPSTPDIIN